MRRVAHSAPKTCLRCGSRFHRGVNEVAPYWEKRKFCGVACSRLARSESDRARREMRNQCQDIHPSDALNERIWRLYARVANDRGLANPLVAAVALGMRA